MKITEYPSASFFDTGDVLIKDGTNGTKKITSSDLVYALFDGIPEMHNQIYRGKNLGSTVTAEQIQAIRNGSFHDLWVGDYWEIDGIKYTIADFNYFYGVGSSSSLTKPHANIVTSCLGICIFNSSPFTVGYNGSSAKSTILNYHSDKFTVFSDYVLTHRDVFTNKCSESDKNVQTGGVDTKYDLLSLRQLTGSCDGSSQSDVEQNQANSWYMPGKGQMALFRFNSKFITDDAKIDDTNTNGGYWVQDIQSGYWAICIGAGGDVAKERPTVYKGLKVQFCIG